jgi:hypothetical protein
MAADRSPSSELLSFRGIAVALRRESSRHLSQMRRVEQLQAGCPEKQKAGGISAARHEC